MWGPRWGQQGYGVEGQVEDWEDCGDPGVWSWELRPRCGVGGLCLTGL